MHLQHHETNISDLYICTVYSPHAESPKDKKNSFYTELNGSTTQFQNKPGQLIFIGDFNARLGAITGDHSTNSNKEAFMDFLNNHSLINLNVLKTFGQYTFHNIRCGNRSIIDFLLTDMEETQIPIHSILPGSLGTSAQTGHKALFSKILVNVKQELQAKPSSIPRWRAITAKNYERFIKDLKDELFKLSPEDYNYNTLLACLNRSKTISLGRTRPRPSTARNPTPEIDRLDTALGLALENHRKKPTRENLLKAMKLEKQIKNARKST